MKKIIYLLILLLFPFNVLAYSNYIIPGGETLGIEVNNDGILLVGFYKVNNKNLNSHLKIGDIITKIGDKEVTSVNELLNNVNSYIVDEKVTLTIIRDNKEINDYLYLEKENGTYKTGLYVKSSISGIGTLTYLDSETGIYGVLGHVINESKTNQKVEVKDGSTYLSKTIEFIRSTNGHPGSKNAKINKDNKFGNIINNTEYGVFGKTNKKIDKKPLEVGDIHDVKLGHASIYTTNLDNEVEEYDIKIIEIDKNNIEKNYYFEVTDELLLSLSGGIVQGMSGSPIIQDNKIIGAVTRVIVDDVKRGYGINIKTMLEEGDKIN